MKFTGIKKVKNNIKKMQKDVNKDMVSDIELIAAQKILEEADKQVPLDTGDLRDSKKIEKLRDKTRISYNTVYARRLHYNPSYNFQNGRKAYYLTDPLLAFNLKKVAIDHFKKRLKNIF